MSDQQPPAGDDSPMSGSQPPTDPPPPAPVNPYGTPAAPPPPPAPVNPYETPSAPPPPAAQPPYGTPQDPQYGTPSYGTPPPPQPAMGAGGYPGMPGEPVEKAGKGLAITALILSLIVCIPYVPALIAIVLAVVVLARSRNGVNRGKGLAIAAIIISVLASVAWTVLFVLAANGTLDEFANELNPVSALDTGDCFNADGLEDEDEEFVTSISEVSCSSPHDAQVLASTDFTADEAEAYENDNTLCDTLVTEAGYVVTADLGLTSLTANENPNAGERLACVVYNLDGSKLDGAISPTG